jgi:hypothetical protein
MGAIACPQVFAAGAQCKNSAFGDETRRMLKTIQRFSKHCNYISVPSALFKAFKKGPINIFTLKTATAIFAETLDNF